MKLVLLLAPLIVFLFHMVLWSFGMYHVIPFIDNPMHFFGGFSIGIFFFGLDSFLRSEAKVLTGRKLTDIIIVIGSVTIAAVFWEYLEFIGYRFLGYGFEISLSDTLKDIFIGQLGGIISFITGTRLVKNN